MSILFVVPARGGSKGIPNKNLRLIHGKSLTWWALDFSTKVSNQLKGSIVCISSDSKSLLAESRGFSNILPVRRPDSISGDTATDQEVLLHALKTAEESLSTVFDYVVMLQPTAPGRSIEEFRAALTQHLSRRNGATATWSVSLVPEKYRSEKLIRRAAQGGGFYLEKSRSAPPRRQDLEEEFYRNGDFYILDRSALQDPYLVGLQLECWLSFEQSVNIDDFSDLKRARKVCFVKDGSLVRIKGAL